MNNSLINVIISIYFQLFTTHIKLTLKLKSKVIYYLIAKLQIITNNLWNLGELI